MKLDESRYGMSDNSAVVTPPECVGVIFTAEHQVYADTGFEAMRDQTFGPEPYVYDPSQTAPTDIQQTVVVFPSAEQAQAVLAASQKQWQSCSRSEVIRKYQEASPHWNLGRVELNNDILTVAMAKQSAEGGAGACQQVLGVRENVVVSTRTCLAPDVPYYLTPSPDLAGDAAERLAAAMLDKVKI